MFLNIFLITKNLQHKIINYKFIFLVFIYLFPSSSFALFYYSYFILMDFLLLLFYCLFFYLFSLIFFLCWFALCFYQHFATQYFYLAHFYIYVHGAEAPHSAVGHFRLDISIISVSCNERPFQWQVTPVCQRAERVLLKSQFTTTIRLGSPFFFMNLPSSNTVSASLEN